MTITRRTLLTGSAAAVILGAVRLATLEEHGAELTDDGVLTIRTISGKLKHFRVVREEYLDAYGLECQRHRIEAA